MMDLEIRSPSFWPATADEEDDHHHWLHRPEQICHGCLQAVYQALDAAADLKPVDMPPKTASRHRPIQASRRRPHRAAARSRPATAAAARGPRQGRPPPSLKPTPSLLDRPHLHARWGPATPETREGGRAPATAVGLRAQAGGVLRRRQEEGRKMG